MPVSGHPAATLFPLGDGDDTEDGWSAAAVHRGQEHVRFGMKRPGMDLSDKVELADDADLCSVQKAASHGAGQ
jgi:hypothetical protein